MWSTAWYTLTIAPSEMIQVTLFPRLHRHQYRAGFIVRIYPVKELKNKAVQEFQLVFAGLYVIENLCQACCHGMECAVQEVVTV
mmetsp:Transcript_32253/g.57871  ORF Transcript_32253/g.57871 Transcript_32253/m.57871 type:complete len:84 (-) Transcript_32253:438-689(-)